MATLTTSCGACGTPVRAEILSPVGGAACGKCGAPTELHVFPALWREHGVNAGERLIIHDDSACFHHPEKRATIVCEGCGRFRSPSVSDSGTTTSRLMNILIQFGQVLKFGRRENKNFAHTNRKTKRGWPSFHIFTNIFRVPQFLRTIHSPAVSARRDTIIAGV